MWLSNGRRMPRLHLSSTSDAPDTSTGGGLPAEHGALSTERSEQVEEQTGKGSSGVKRVKMADLCAPFLKPQVPPITTSSTSGARKTRAGGSAVSSCPTYDKRFRPITLSTRPAEAHHDHQPRQNDNRESTVSPVGAPINQEWLDPYHCIRPSAVQEDRNGGTTCRGARLGQHGGEEDGATREIIDGEVIHQYSSSPDHTTQTAQHSGCPPRPAPTAYNQRSAGGVPLMGVTRRGWVDDVEDSFAHRLGHNGVEVQVPGSINRHLRPYQREGVEFMFTKYAEGTGGVLADDMGLGKTVQAIAFITAVLNRRAREADGGGPAVRPVLVVVPTSVIANWCREFEQWSSGYYQVAAVHGPSKERGLDAIRSGEAQVVVVSYGTWLALDKSGNGLHTLPWELAVYDEAHTLKSNLTQIYTSAAKIRTKRRYGLTGTVMPNSYDELWCLMDFMAAGCLGPAEAFHEHYSKHIKLGQKSNASAAELQKGNKRSEQLTTLLHKHLLRRTKDTTIRDQLPRKVDNIVLCRLSKMQLRAYQRLLACADFQLLVRMNEDCDCGSGVPRKACCHWSAPRSEGGVLWPQLHCCPCSHPFDPFTNPKGCKRHKPEGCSSSQRGGCPVCLMGPCISLLQKVSNHLELVKADPQRLAAAAHCAEELSLSMARAEEQARLVLGEDAEALGGLCTDRSFLATSDAQHCGKMVALKQLLGQWAAERGRGGADAPKVLLFSYSTRMLDILESLMNRYGYSYSRLDGSTNQRERQERVDHFNNSNSCFVFLVSTRAGGLGLNLTSANKVVVFDPHWNPAYDLQAQDRAFRIGQKRNVSVYRLVSLGTLEELVYNRQVYKQQQSDRAVMGAERTRLYTGVQPRSGHPAEEKGELWGILNLLQLTADRIKTREIQQAAQLAEAQCMVQRFEADDDSVQETPEMLKLVELFSGADEMETAELAEKVEEIMAQGRGKCTVGGAGEDEAAEASRLAAGGGVAHMFTHQSLMGGGEKAAKRKKGRRGGGASGGGTAAHAKYDGRGERDTDTEEGRPGGGGSGPPSSSAHEALRSLAVWKGVGVAVMAQRLLGMGEAERFDMRERYSADCGEVRAELTETQ